MSVQKSRLKSLLEKRFQVTMFYNFLTGFHEGYYIILDGAIQLRIILIDDVYVIDEVICLTKAYVSPIYEKLIELCSSQQDLTIIVAMYGSSRVLNQVCAKAGLPKVNADDRFSTIPKGLYEKLTMLSEGAIPAVDVGYYLLSVSDKPSEIGTKVIGQEPQLTEIAKILREKFEHIKISTLSNTEIEVTIADSVSVKATFLVTIIEGKLVIRNLLSDSKDTMGFVQLSRLVDTIEKFISVNPTVLITDVKSVELYRICEARGYKHISEDKKIFHSNLFNQVHCGYGTYQVIMNVYNT